MRFHGYIDKYFRIALKINKLGPLDLHTPWHQKYTHRSHRQTNPNSTIKTWLWANISWIWRIFFVQERKFQVWIDQLAFFPSSTSPSVAVVSSTSGSTLSAAGTDSSTGIGTETSSGSAMGAFLAASAAATFSSSVSRSHKKVAIKIINISRLFYKNFLCQPCNIESKCYGIETKGFYLGLPDNYSHSSIRNRWVELKQWCKQRQ